MSITGHNSLLIIIIIIIIVIITIPELPSMYVLSSNEYHQIVCLLPDN